MPKPLIAALLAVGFTIISANTAFSAYFQDRVYPGVKVAGVSLGGLTRDEARSRLATKLTGYSLVLKVGGQDYRLVPDQLGVVYDLDATIDVAMSRGRDAWPPLLALLQARDSQPINYAYAVDRAKLSDFVTTLSVAHSQAPVDATVVVVNGQPKVQPDQAGLGLNGQHFEQQLELALGTQGTSLAMPDESIPAGVKASDAAAALPETQKLLATSLELDGPDRTFNPTANDIGQWLTFLVNDGKLVPTLDTNKLRVYTGVVANSLYVAPKVHLVNVVNGQVNGEEPGINGRAVDQDSLVNSIIATMNGGGGKVSVPLADVPFKTVYNRTVNLDYGRYIEVNLSQQHLWAYQDHQAIFDSPLTSGATGAGLGTVTGLFSIYGKERNRNLNGYAIGYNYNVFVQYWMPFYRDYGLHDASWRSSFGGQDYYYGGSHGCINLPLDTAIWIWNWADIGTPVWVHT